MWWSPTERTLTIKLTLPLIGAGLALAAVALPTAARTGMGRMTVKEITPRAAPASNAQDWRTQGEALWSNRPAPSDTWTETATEARDHCEKDGRKHRKKDRQDRDRKDRDHGHGDREKHGRGCD